MATFGAEAKTGWCVLVGVTGDVSSPRVVARERVALCPDSLPAFAYHVAAEVPPAEAKAVVDKVAAAALACATEALRRVETGIGALAVGAGAGEWHDDLDWILKAHTRWHAGEGSLYREALVEAAGVLGVRVVRFAKGAALSELAAELQRDPDALARTIAGWGKALGPPWRKEHKDAAAAAWLGLVRTS